MSLNSILSPTKPAKPTSVSAMEKRRDSHLVKLPDSKSPMTLGQLDQNSDTLTSSQDSQLNIEQLSDGEVEDIIKAERKARKSA